MLIDKVKTYAQSLMDSGKDIEEVKSLVAEFIGDEDVTDSDGKVVDYNIKQAEEKENVDIELNVKKMVKKTIEEEMPEIKTTPRVVSREVKDIIPATAKRFGTLKSFTGPNAEEDAYKSGMWLMATLGVPSGIKFCQDHGIELKTTQVEGTDNLGGFLTPEVLLRALIHNVDKFGVMRQLCQVYPMSSDVAYVPKVTTDLDAIFIDEASSITEQNKVYERVTLTAKKVAALTRISSELNADSIIPIIDITVQNLANRIARREDWVILNGSGQSDEQSSGITGVIPTLLTDNTNGGKSVISASTDDWSAMVLADLHSLMGRLPEYAYTNNTAWVCSNTFASVVLDRLAAAAGGNTIQTIAGGVSKFQRAFMGYPVYTTPLISDGGEDPSSTGNTKIVCMFGDFSKGVAFGDRGTIEFKTDTSRYFDTDEIAIRATRRMAVTVHEPASVNTAGPIIGLLA